MLSLPVRIAKFGLVYNSGIEKLKAGNMFLIAYIFHFNDSHINGFAGLIKFQRYLKMVFIF